jgi:hypothetical protein
VRHSAGVKEGCVYGGGWLVGRSALLYMDMQTDGPGTGIILSVVLRAQYNIPFSSAPVLYIHKQFCTTLCYMRDAERESE